MCAKISGDQPVCHQQSCHGQYHRDHIFPHSVGWCEHYPKLLAHICQILCTALLPHDWLIRQLHEWIPNSLSSHYKIRVSVKLRNIRLTLSDIYNVRNFYRTHIINRTASMCNTWEWDTSCLLHLLTIRCRVASLNRCATGQYHTRTALPEMEQTYSKVEQS